MLTVLPKRANAFAFAPTAYAVTNAFFPMLDVPFQYGSGWTPADEDGAAQVAVISQRVNDRLFGGTDSVGRSITVDGRDYRVVGVVANWNPEPRFFDLLQTQGMNGFGTHPTGLYLPFSTAVAAQMGNGDGPCFKQPANTGYAAWLRSTCTWISYIAQLDTPAAAQRYKTHLEGFARQRSSWPPNVSHKFRWKQGRVMDALTVHADRWACDWRSGRAAHPALGARGCSADAYGLVAR